MRRLPAVVFRGLGCVLSAFGVFACLSGLAWLHTLNPKPSFLKVPTQGTNTLSVVVLRLDLAVCSLLLEVDPSDRPYILVGDRPLFVKLSNFLQ